MRGGVTPSHLFSGGLTMMIREINAGATPAVNNTTPPVRTEGDARTNAAVVRSGGDRTTTTPESGRFELAQLHTVNDRQNSIASAIRRDDQQLTEAGRVLGQMKDQLYEIVKIYPPYPVGDADRIRFLRSFSGLRQQIDNLTIPPAKKWEGAQFDATPATEQPVPVSAPVPRTVSGIPRLSENASDKEIKAAMERIDRTIASLVAQQDRLGSQAEAIQGAQGRQDKVAIIGQVSGGGWDIAVPGEQAAEKLGSEVRREVAGLTSTSIFGAQPQLAALAG